MSAFRAALRLSWRETRHVKGRTALVMTMIGLPVLVITALLTYYATVDVTLAEDPAAVLGAADARIVTTAYTSEVSQSLGGDIVLATENSTPAGERTADEVTALLDARLIPYDTGSVELRDSERYHEVRALELDLRDPMTRGIRLLAEGRFPAAAGEVAVTPALARKTGVRVGDTITVTALERRVRVVGVVEHPYDLNLQEVSGLRDTLLLDKRGGHGAGWLADTDRPVLWEDVERLNGIGMLVTSRAVVTGPPVPGVPAGPHDPVIGAPAVVAMATMAALVVMEIALLTGPAFAIGLRRRRRELALIAAQGGSARHLRTIVLADGLLLGGVAAVLAAVLGTGGTLALMPLLKHLLGASGPADVPWGLVLGVVALGVAGALFAALMPAVSAARQDPAPILTGREDSTEDPRSARGLAGHPEASSSPGDSSLVSPAPARASAPGGSSLVSPGSTGGGRPGGRPGSSSGRRRWRVGVAGPAVLSLVGGLALTGYALGGGKLLGVGSDPLLLPAGLLVVLGLVGLIPGVVTALGRRAGRLPLPLRLAVRDAARHRTRTASAAAAVMAATMAAVTLGIAVESTFDATLLRYRPQQPPDALRIAARNVDDRGWADLRAAAAEALPGVPLVPAGRVFDKEGRAVQIVSETDACGSHCLIMEPPVGDARLLAFAQGRSDPRAAEALAAGKAVVFGPVRLQNGTLALQLYANGGGTELVRIPAVTAEPDDPRRIGAVIPPAALEKEGYAVAERLLFATHRPDDLPRLQRQLSLPTGRADVWIFDREMPSTLGTLWWAFGMALLLSLGGTLAATGLAAADLRRDLDIVSAVGAPPRTRRAILAAQAAFIAGIGTVVGAVGGAVMGTAAAVPMTRRGEPVEGLGPVVLSVPWTAIALVVVGAPLLAALIAGLVTRSRQGPPPRRLA